jgi:hypothetical protein
MAQADLGTKRQCPKCAAKFYDFGVVDPITCPKCGKTWRDETAKPKKVKKENPVKVVKPKKILDDELDDLGMPNGGGGTIEEIEPMEDEDVEMTSLQEVEEHEEAEENDSNSDDAEDDMFTDLSGDNKIVDDLEDHLETEDDENEDDDEDEDSEDENDEDDEDDDDGAKRKKRRR